MNSKFGDLERRSEDTEINAYLNKILPPFSWRIKGTHNFDMSWTPFRLTSNMRQLVPYIPHTPRLLKRQVESVFKNMSSSKEKEFKEPDLFSSNAFIKYCGVPVGGIGCGSIDRSIFGDFMRMRMAPGQRTNAMLHGCVFILTIRQGSNLICQYALCKSHKHPDSITSKTISCIPAQFIEFYGLYPRSWTVYHIPGFMYLIIEQTSPVIAHNYTDTSLPVCVFTCHAFSYHQHVLDISLALCWQTDLHSTGPNTVKSDIRERCHAVMSQHILRDCSISFGIAAQTMESPFLVSSRKHVDMNSIKDVQQLLNDLATRETCLTEHENDESKFTYTDSKRGSKRSCRGMVVARQVKLYSRKPYSFKFVLAWHMPHVKFSNSDITHTRYYTKVFDSLEQMNVMDIIVYGLANSERWERELDQWQFSETIKGASNYSDLLKSCLFNELYYMTSGGSLWLKTAQSRKKSATTNDEWGKFLLLEGWDMPMYNTYDVMFYASAAIIKLWPNFQLSVQYDFADLISQEDPTRRRYLLGSRGQAKTEKCIPHDVGGPFRTPWEYVNAFERSGVDDWRDLNLKFIISVYRDYTVTESRQFLLDMYCRMQPLIDLMERQDVNGDGLVDNTGLDQTYDDWPMYGCSAYCGSLQLCALRCLVETTKLVEPERTGYFEAWLERASMSYDKTLWNGEYYVFDTKSDALMADQLLGYWYLLQCGLKATDGHLKVVWSPERVQSVLSCLLHRNTETYAMAGFVNGVRKTRSDKWVVDIKTIQSKECWIGVSYALIAILYHTKGFETESDIVLNRLTNLLWNEIGVAFQTPEALCGLNKSVRSVGYMRPMSIWSLPLISQANDILASYVESADL